MTEHTITPVTNPTEQVEYWITQGIAAKTSLSQDEARKSAQHLLAQAEVMTNTPKVTEFAQDGRRMRRQDWPSGMFSVEDLGPTT